MTIDVHGHLSPLESLRRYPIPPSLTDVDGMVARKAAAGVRMTIIGSPVGAGAMVPVPGVDNYAQSDDELRAFHDWMAGTVARYPNNLRALVYANPFGSDSHLAAAADTLTADAFVGFIVNTSVAGRYLDDDRADAFFAMAAESDVPVMLHAPAQPAAGTGLVDLGSLEQIGRPCDVTVGVAACILGGWLDRYPRLRLIATAAGGALAVLAERLDAAHLAARRRPPGGPQPPAPGSGQVRPRRPALSQPPSSYLRRIWVDTASPSPLSLRANVEVFGADRVMFGTDSPPLLDAVAPTLAAIDDLPIPAADKDRIRSGNAVELFGLREVVGQPR